MNFKRPPRRPSAWGGARFTDHRAQDVRDTVALYKSVKKQFDKSVYSKPEAVDRSALALLDALRPRAPAALEDSFLYSIDAMLRAEAQIFGFPRNDPSKHVLSLKDQVDMRHFLRAKEHFLSNSDQALKMLGPAITAIFEAITERLPPFEQSTSGMTVPLISLLRDATGAVEDIIGICAEESLDDFALIAAFKDSVWRNVCRVSGNNPDDPKKAMVLPSASGMAPEEMAERYLADTPLLALLQAQVPFVIPRKTWASHGIILAPPNHGKTQLLGSLIADFLRDDVHRTGLFVLDPHGDLFNNLRLRVHHDRLVLLDPDTNPPPLNFLDFGTSTEAQTLQTFSYLMSSLSGGLSDKQGAIVPYLLKLLRRIPDASLETLRLIIDEKVKTPGASKFAPEIAALPAIDQGFFHSQFYHQEMQQTKQAIGWKIYSAMSSDAFRQMFSPKTETSVSSFNHDPSVPRFDADAAMREQKVVLVKGARSSLGDAGMQVFLQFMVAQFMSAALRREALHPSQRHLCVLFADEAHHIFNSQTSNILTECRKYGLGFVAATQVVQQIPEDVKAAIYGATAIKIAGPVSYTDAQILAREMYTTGDFIRSMRARERESADWAFFVSGLTDKAVRVTVPYGALEAMPKQKAPPLPVTAAATPLPPVMDKKPTPAPEQQETPPVSTQPIIPPPDDDITTAKPGGWRK